MTPGPILVDEEARVARQDLEVRLEHGTRTLVLHVRLTLPKEPRGPYPVVVQGSFGFGRPGPGRVGGSPALKKQGPRPNFTGIFTTRGYAVAEFNFQEAALDSKEKGRTASVYHLFGETLDCGALMAWAWGIHRVIDALEGDPRIDRSKIIVTGHSRYAKATLLAGAFDERIALTVPSHSGCAGAAPYRFIYGKSEQIQNIVGFAPY